jgi:branched-chain amino acid transport system substrate-binding protein
MNVKVLLILCLTFTILHVRSQIVETIKIGLLVQDKASLAAKQGAELAIKLANEKREGNSHQFQLITKDMEGPWGTGSKQAVDLIFENEVWALLGSHDGRNAHLVEQAATKSTMVFVSAWATDPTLSQAYVPWFFNCVPNDGQQAEELIQEIYKNRKYTRTAVLYDKAYDSDQAVKNFLKKVKLAEKKEPAQFLFDDYMLKLNALADQIRKENVSCILLFCTPSASLSIIRLLRQRAMNLPVFGTFSILNENKLSDKELQEFDQMLLIPSGTWNGSKVAAFRQAYQKSYGRMPGMVAAYAFDGMNLLIDAIKTSRVPEREKIQNYLENVLYEGVTGTFRFDAMGSRLEKRFIMQTKKGVPVAVGSN